MTDPVKPEDELAGTEQPFIQHLIELRDRLLRSVYGIGLVLVVLLLVTLLVVVPLIVTDGIVLVEVPPIVFPVPVKVCTPVLAL